MTSPDDIRARALRFWTWFVDFAGIEPDMTSEASMRELDERVRALGSYG